MTGLLARLAAAAGLALASLVVVGASPAYACSCIQVDTATAAKLADRVFTGTVEQRTSGDKLAVRYDVAVASVYKGEVAGRVEVTTPGSPASCGLPDLPEGTELMWFASERNPAGGRPAEGSGTGELRLFVSSCDPNGPATPRVVTAVTGALGQPQPPAAAPDDPSEEPPSGTAEETRDAQDQRDDGTTVWPWALGAGVLAAGAVGLVVARRRTG